MQYTNDSHNSTLIQVKPSLQFREWIEMGHLASAENTELLHSTHSRHDFAANDRHINVALKGHMHLEGSMD